MGNCFDDECINVCVACGRVSSSGYSCRCMDNEETKIPRTIKKSPYEYLDVINHDCGICSNCESTIMEIYITSSQVEGTYITEFVCKCPEYSLDNIKEKSMITDFEMPF